MSFDPADAFEAEWVSECCGAPAYVGVQPDHDLKRRLGKIATLKQGQASQPLGVSLYYEGKDHATGICSRCKDHASFVKADPTTSDL